MTDKTTDTPLDIEIAAYVEAYKDAGCPTVAEARKNDILRSTDEQYLRDVAVAIANIYLGPDIEAWDPDLMGRDDASEWSTPFENLRQARLFECLMSQQYDAIKAVGNDILTKDEQKEWVVRALNKVSPSVDEQRRKVVAGL